VEALSRAAAPRHRFDLLPLLPPSTPQDDDVTDPKFLPTFAGWLRTMGEDVLSLANLLESAEAPEPFRQVSAEALQYLLRAADLIPEGLEPLGYLEVAFAFRVLAERALLEHPELAEPGAEGRVPRLAADATLVAEFLGDDLPHFLQLALAPAASTRAGRAATDLLTDDELRGSALREAREWVELSGAPDLADGSEELVKIGSFFRTRLRRAS
jgi:hypothetical protein